MSQQFWCVDPLQHPTLWRFCGLVNQPSLKILQNSHEKVFITGQNYVSQKRDKNECHWMNTVSGNSGQDRGAHKRTLHAQSTFQFSLCGFYVILLQICSQDMDLWEIVWLLPLKVVLEGTPCHPSESHPSLSVPWETSLRNTGWVRVSHHSSALYWLSSPKHFFFYQSI